VVSQALVRTVRVGDWLRLGPAVGTLTLDEASSRDVLLIAGSTGLAPLKAMLEQLSARQMPPKVHLFFGARARDALYDLDDLRKRAARLPWLTVVPTVSDEAVADTEHGDLPDVVARHGRWDGHDAYICGPPDMAVATAARLERLGLSRDHIRLESFGDAQR
jgi:NAD(P)H-flavin reductase